MHSFEHELDDLVDAFPNFLQLPAHLFVFQDFKTDNVLEDPPLVGMLQQAHDHQLLHFIPSFLDLPRKGSALLLDFELVVDWPLRNHLVNDWAEEFPVSVHIKLQLAVSPIIYFCVNGLHLLRADLLILELGIDAAIQLFPLGIFDQVVAGILALKSR